MIGLTRYIAGSGPVPTRRSLNRMIERWEWFTTARRARTIVTGEPDAALTLPLMFWTTVIPTERHCGESGDGAIPPRHREESGDETIRKDIIDRFIEHGGYRIVPGNEEYQAKVDVDIDPEMVTAELAEIYRKQGLDAEAEKIYRILNAR